MDNRRAYPRHAVQIEGKLILGQGQGARALDCTIIDISEGGARVSVTVQADLPEQLYLWNSETDALYDCEVRWREAKYLGLCFVDTCGRQKRQVLLKKARPADPSYVGRITRWLKLGVLSHR